MFLLGQAMTDECVCPKHHCIDKDGYPRVKWQKKLWRLNRLMWYLSFGEIPIGQVVAHSCNNKSCVNQNHFYLTTSQINSTHAARDGLYKPYTRFKQEDLLTMWNLYNIEGWTQQAIADQFQTSQTAISSCLKRYER